MVLLRPLLLVWLGAHLAIGSPLVPRSPQSAATEQSEKAPPSSSSPPPSSNGLGQVLEKYAPVLIGVAGLGIGYAAREPEVRRMQTEIDWLRQRVGAAERSGIPPDAIVFEKDGVRLTLQQCRHFQIMAILKEADAQPILEHLGETSFNKEAELKIVKECENQAMAWAKRGAPNSWPTVDQVWVDAHNTVRDYIPRRKEQPTGDGSSPPNVAFTLASTKHLIENAPLAAQQLGSTIQKGTPGAMKYVMAGLASQGRTALRNVKPGKGKMAVVP
ncbi:MAG: hypothetical protein M1823_005166 [Watsoniomyces obsoletus]|nr:MAG: hypothetical protein M1823_005166 [Watsoniomyces obsoletus]